MFERFKLEKAKILTQGSFIERYSQASTKLPNLWFESYDIGSGPISVKNDQFRSQKPESNRRRYDFDKYNGNNYPLNFKCSKFQCLVVKF